jgi:hypothetical protein
VSPLHRGVVWTHNDSGGGARIFAVATDKVVGDVLVRGAENRDWEAIAPGPDDTLYIGDIGDNFGRRSAVTVYRLPEPRVLGAGVVDAEVIRLRYPDGRHDAEALLVEPRTGQIFLATKGENAHLYAAPVDPRPGVVEVMSRVTSVPPAISDGAFAADGRLVLRDYGRAFLYRAPGDLERTIDLPRSRQGESIGFTPGGDALLAGSEGANSQVWWVPLRPEALPWRPTRDYVVAPPSVPGRAFGPGEASLGVLVVAGAAAVLAARRARTLTRSG